MSKAHEHPTTEVLPTYWCVGGIFIATQGGGGCFSSLNACFIKPKWCWYRFISIGSNASPIGPIKPKAAGGWWEQGIRKFFSRPERCESRKDYAWGRPGWWNLHVNEIIILLRHDINQRFQVLETRLASVFSSPHKSTPSCSLLHLSAQAIYFGWFQCYQGTRSRYEVWQHLI